MLTQNPFEIEDGILKAYTGPEAEIQIPEGVHTIGEGVFKGMAHLLKVTLPSSLKNIGPTAFKGCRQLKSINIPEGLEEIGEYAFHRCHSIEEMVFPRSMTKVGGYAFLYCDGLKKVVMEGPKRLGKAVFSHNLSLQEVTLNKNLDDSNFSEEVFEGCVQLHRITLSDETYEVGNLIETMNSHAAYPEVIKSIAKSVYHSLQIEDGVLMKFNINLKAIVLPEGITAIGKGCFFDKKGIVSITLPKSLQEIKANAFLNCLSLEEITFQSEKVVLDEKAFCGCCNLKKVYIQGEISTYRIGDETKAEETGSGVTYLSETEAKAEETGSGATYLPETEAKAKETGSGATYLLEDETDNELASRIRDQVMGDFYISGKTLIRYMGNEEQIQIPKEVEIIGERCFFGKEQLKTVLCPDGLLEICEQAFAGCLTLQNIVLPTSLRRVEREAFAECKKLLKCNLPETLEYIGEYAFRRCFTLRIFDPWPENAEIHPYAFYLAKQFADATVRAYKDTNSGAVGQNRDLCGRNAYCEQGNTLSMNDDPGHAENGLDVYIAPYAHARREGIKVLKLSGVKRIGKYAYSSCPDLEEIEIDAPECVIEQNAFATCPKLKKASLSVKELGREIFSYCRNLQEVSLSGVFVLPAESFIGCSSLMKFEAKEVTAMEARCFDECIALDSFDFSGIGVIGERAFERCDSLKKVELNRVECGCHAFADCAGLEMVKITQNTLFKSGAFIGCTQVHTIDYAGTEYAFSKFQDGLNHTNNPYPLPVREVIASIYSCFDVRERKILAGYTQDAARITIPQDIEEIGQDVFRDHVRLSRIQIPESVKLFGSHAFSQTAWLDEQRESSELVIVNHVLLDGALCKGKVELPRTVKRVASWCFAGNIDITELVIPSDRIGIESLSFRNCLNLKRITDWNQKEYVLQNVKDLKEKEYPELIRRIFSECVNCFKLDENGNLIESTGNITELTFPEGIRSVGDGVYKDCHLLEKIVLSGDTESIGKSAFENSKWLRSVKGASAVTAIGAQAFSGCQSLESIDLSDCLRELGNRCFEHCCSLKEIHLSMRLEKIPERAFFRCKSLRKVTIPASVKVIEREAFAFCDNLEEAYLAEGVQLDESAFAYCDRLEIHWYQAKE